MPYLIKDFRHLMQENKTFRILNGLYMAYKNVQKVIPHPNLTNIRFNQ